MRERPGQHGLASHPAWRWLFAATLLAICVNTLWFGVRAANPLIVSDTWHFVDSVVMPYAHGDFGIGDLFVKRSAMDHSQPLRKVVLLANYEWFGLDFKLEAVVGLCGALAGLLALWLMGRSARNGRRSGPIEYLAFTALAAGYLSLSATVVYSWPLVTMNFTNHVFIFAFIWTVWRAVTVPDWKTLAIVVAAGLALCLVADDTGLLAATALAMATLLHGWRTQSLRTAMLVALACVAAYVLYAVIYRLISATPEAGTAALPLWSRLTALGSQWRHALEWLTVPLVGALVHRRELGTWFGQDSMAIGLLAGMMILVQLWFWWSALRGHRNIASFAGTAIMLLFYGLLAGILISRISEHGTEYLWQPRYALIYRWNLVALCLMLLGQLAGRAASRTGERVPRDALHWPVIASCLAAAFVLMQIPLSTIAWERLPFVERYHRKEAMQLRQLAQTPDAPTPSCLPGLVICRFPVERRSALLEFLNRQQLNVFSPEFRRRHGMDVEPVR